MNLFAHQKEAVEFILKRGGSGAVFHEMGLGKTRTAIEIFRELRKKDPALKLLVIAPLSLLEAAWANDIRKFAPGTKVHNWHEDGAPKKDDYDVLVINYESAVSEKNVKEIYRLASAGKWAIVCDESSRMKDFRSKTSKTLLQIRDRFPYRIVMSGTPAPNNETEYWAQMEFVRPGILHKSFYAFRNTFFHLENKRGDKFVAQGNFVPPSMMSELYRKGYGYSLTPAKRQQLMGIISPFCHWAKKVECLDLPDQIDELRYVEMGAKQRVFYNELKQDLITEIEGSAITAQVALTKVMKLREITSGFAIDETGVEKEVGESPKLKELINTVEEAGNQQAIIWANFHWEIRKIREALAPLGRVVTLYSGTENRNESINDFLDGNARFLVAHPRSAAHGLTLVNCSLEIFFSLDFSYESHEQARARIHRAGQKKKCTYVYIVAKDSIDETILAALQKKQKAQEIIYALFPKKFREPELQRAG